MRYIDMLPDLVYSYNHSVRRSIKTEPSLVTSKKENKVRVEWVIRYELVRLKENLKGYLPNFSKEMFTISKQIPHQPPVYKLRLRRRRTTGNVL